MNYQHVEELSKETPYTAVQQFLSYIMDTMVMVPSGPNQRSSATEVMQRTGQFLKELKKTTPYASQLPNFAETMHLY